MGSLDEWICAECGTTDIPRMKARGSGWVTFVLLLFFVIPGLIHFAWRMTHWRRECPACGSDRIVPVDSPRGRDLRSVRQGG